MPDHLDQTAATAAEHEQVPTHRITLQRLLYHQRQTRKAFAHVGMACRQPDLYTCRDRDHRSPSTQSRIRPSASVSMSLSTRTRRPRPSSIVTSLRLRRGWDGAGGSGIAGEPAEAVSDTITGTNMLAAPADGPSTWQSSLRQRKSWLTWMPAARAISEITASGSRQAATNCSFSSRDHRRRRSTDVITSIGCFVIGLSLVFALGLPMLSLTSQGGPHRGLTS
nr:hypothetical protein [Shinella sp. HZN7]